jgi:hypothetical protein
MARQLQQIGATHVQLQIASQALPCPTLLLQQIGQTALRLI